MDKILNIKKIEHEMFQRGLNQAGIAKKVGVSRAIVSSWLKGQKFPRPDKLLKMGLALEMPFDSLVQKSVMAIEPVVAFRKKGRRKTKTIHLTYAMEMGKLLELLVPYLPFDGMFQQPTLNTPQLEYHYIQKAAERIRMEMGVADANSIDFKLLIAKLNEFQVVLIPVFHGQKEHHENALHIFLPTSKTTWIYLNLDSNVHDFKFWIAHELGHVLSPSLTGESAEDFADTFAQALLFPQAQAAEAYAELKHLRSKQLRIKHMLHLAEKFIISPVTIFMAIKEYALKFNFDLFELEPDIYAASTSLNNKYPTVSEMFNDGKPYSAYRYIKVATTLFNSPFFNTLKIYLSENDKGPGFVQSILNTPILDAKEIHAELVQ